MVINTTYEPESYYTLANNPTPTTDLWISKNGTSWRKLLSLPWEGTELPSGMSRGSISFPGGFPLEDLFYVPESTAKEKFTTQVIRIDEE